MKTCVEPVCNSFLVPSYSYLVFMVFTVTSGGLSYLNVYSFQSNWSQTWDFQRGEHRERVGKSQHRTKPALLPGKLHFMMVYDHNTKNFVELTTNFRFSHYTCIFVIFYCLVIHAIYYIYLQSKITMAVIFDFHTVVFHNCFHKVFLTSSIAVEAIQSANPQVLSGYAISQSKEHRWAFTHIVWHVKSTNTSILLQNSPWNRRVRCRVAKPNSEMGRLRIKVYSLANLQGVLQMVVSFPPVN